MNNNFPNFLCDYTPRAKSDIYDCLVVLYFWFPVVDQAGYPPTFLCKLAYMASYRSTAHRAYVRCFIASCRRRCDVII